MRVGGVVAGGNLLDCPSGDLGVGSIDFCALDARPRVRSGLGLIEDRLDPQLSSVGHTTEPLVG